jgi:pimeloyl-ACP methyl ester carboxylesterase
VLKKELPADGRHARVTYYDTGHHREALVFANGLGGPHVALRHQVRHFSSRYRVITWDYRGLYASRDAKQPQRVDIEAQVDDLERVLDAADIERAVLVGWSMGVPVMLELCARSPERASHLVLISGAPNRPLGSTGLPAIGPLLPHLIDVARALHPVGERLVGRLSDSRNVARLVRRLGIVSPTIGTDELLELAGHFKALDLDVYFRTLRALDAYDGTQVLDRLSLPTLVIGGGRDFLVPTQVTRSLASRTNAEVLVIPGATHYAPAEFPELVNARIEAFLKAFPDGR